jgi:hypothetical protein
MFRILLIHIWVGKAHLCGKSQNTAPLVAGFFITRDNWMDYSGVWEYMFAKLLKIVQYGRALHLVPVDSISDALVQSWQSISRIFESEPYL